MKLIKNILKYGDRAYRIGGASLVVNFIQGKLQRDALFIHPPKTAGTSLRSALNITLFKNPKQLKQQFPGCGRVSFGHMDVDQLLVGKLVSKTFYDSAFKFAFVRNPYARAVSLFQYLQKINRLDRNLKFLDFCEHLRNSTIAPVGLYDHHGLSQCNPQTAWLASHTLDFIGRLEHLDEQLAPLADQLGVRLKAQLPHLNSSTRRDYRSFYCPESEEIVRSYYADDFKAYNYSTKL